MVVDVTSRQSARLDNSALGVAPFQTAVYVTPDGKSLLLFNRSLTSSYSFTVNAGQDIKVFDIGGNPMNPPLVTSITGSPVPSAGLTGPFYFSSYQVAGNRLFALDVVQHGIFAFTFDRLNSNFSQLGAYAVRGDSVGYSLAASPDGAFIYVPLSGDDAIAVLDANRLSGGRPPLLTMLSANRNPYQVAVSTQLPPARKDFALSQSPLSKPYSATRSSPVLH